MKKRWKYDDDDPGKRRIKREIWENPVYLAPSKKYAIRKNINKLFRIENKLNYLLVELNSFTFFLIYIQI